MSEVDILRRYYERIVAANFPHAGEIEDEEPRLKAVTVRGCHGNSKNQLFFSVTVEDGRVVALTYDCQYCDVTMYVTAELICALLEGQPLATLGQLGDADVARSLGGQVRKVKRQARITLGLLRDGLAAHTKAE